VGFTSTHKPKQWRLLAAAHPLKMLTDYSSKWRRPVAVPLTAVREAFARVAQHAAFAVAAGSVLPPPPGSSSSTQERGFPSTPRTHHHPHPHHHRTHTAGGCPVSPEERDRWLAAQRQQQQQSTAPSAPDTTATSSTSPASGCPANEDARHAARINMPVVPNSRSPQQPPSAAAAAALSTARKASSIPIADPSAVPQHQQGAVQDREGKGHAVWMYPSEQQFFNAMARKVRCAAVGWSCCGRLLRGGGAGAVLACQDLNPPPLPSSPPTNQPTNPLALLHRAGSQRSRTCQLWSPSTTRSTSAPGSTYWVGSPCTLVTARIPSC